MSQPQNFTELKLGNAHIRLRRMRKNANIRALIEENSLQKSDLIYPIFVTERETERTEISSLPGIFRIPMSEIISEVQSAVTAGIKGIMLFPVVASEKKDLFGKESYNTNGLMQNCLRKIKDAFPDLAVFADIALDPFTTHGHDGITNDKGYVLNDETVEALCLQSLSYAACGIDFVCPSDMMDGRIGAIRSALDKEGFIDTGILAYSAKYASAFYGPFREAVASGARGLDKKSYQLNPANSREAIYEALLDIQEGADIIMVKPGLPYLDILTKIKEKSKVPLAIYHVSGEYSMLKIAAEKNIIDEKAAVIETMLAMKRAGADLIVTYYAKWICENLF